MGRGGGLLPVGLSSTIKLPIIEWFDNLQMKGYIMNKNQLYDWLLENGGPSVHLMLGEGNIDEHINKLMGLEKVRSVLDYLDGFRTEERDRKTIEHLIHFYKESSIENFFPILMHYGFRAGMGVLDDRIEPLRKLFKYMLENSEYGTNYGYCLMIHQCFFWAGYNFKEISESFVRRLHKLHINAVNKEFNIYDDSIGIPRIPKAFEGRRAVKRELNPFDLNAEKPLPTIYDIRAMAQWKKISNDNHELVMIEDIINYIMKPEFQSLPEGYGVVWTVKAKRYHACGWSPSLPFHPNSSRNEKSNYYSDLPYMESMSHFDFIKGSDWFLSGLERYKQYRTETGTYIFPADMIRSKYAQEAFLSNTNMTLKSNMRREKFREVFSTFLVYQMLL